MGSWTEKDPVSQIQVQVGETPKILFSAHCAMPHYQAKLPDSSLFEPVKRISLGKTHPWRSVMIMPLQFAAAAALCQAVQMVISFCGASYRISCRPKKLIPASPSIDSQSPSVRWAFPNSAVRVFRSILKAQGRAANDTRLSHLPGD